MDYDLVIKVKYGDTLRRFNAFVNEGIMEIDMASLRAKVLHFFKLSTDADITLTYIDEDNDNVTLVDDNDLRDAVLLQHLNPLRISVTLKDNYQSIPPSENSIPLRSSQVQTQPPCITANVEEALKFVPDPLRGVLLKLSKDALSKASLSSSLLNELVDCASKLGTSSLGPFFHGHDTSAHVCTPGDPSDSTDGYNHKVVQETCDDHASPSNVMPKTTFTSEQIKESKPVEHTVSKAPLNHADDLINFFSSMSTASNPSAFQAPASQEVLNGPKNKQLSFDDVGPSVLPENFCQTSNIDISQRRPGVANVMSPFGYPPFGHRLRRRHGHHDKLFRTFHRGVQCDGCGMHPIVGPRFKSQVKEDYDLCNICFLDMGNEADYVKIDRPMHHSHGLVKEHIPRMRHLGRHQGVKPYMPKLESRFVKDVTVLDGTVMAPNTPFTKIWRMRNDGTVAWPRGTQLVWIAGDLLGARASVELEIPSNGCQVEDEVDVAVDFQAPSRAGRYISYWKMASPTGQKFGQRVWVLIQVDASQSDFLPVGSYPCLYLNLPPESNNTHKGKESIDVNVEPVDNGRISLEQSEAAVEQAKPLLNEHVNDNQDTEYQLGGDDKSSNLVSYPFIELSDLTPAEPTPQPPVGGYSVEDALLKELEEMGFKQIDLNKEVLRKNEYDLENSVDDLCAVGEWDPLLEELQDMGFADRQMNKKLLIKNDGSIKRVVLDLIAGEKA